MDAADCPPQPHEPLFGGIEAGGTKFVCAVGNARSQQLVARASFPTGEDPAIVLAAVSAWLKKVEERSGRLAALGVASFGPVDLDERSPTYGFITTTPKAGWRNTDILGSLRRAFPGVPIGFDTDVNAAALGEGRWGAARGLRDFVYITVGTGIGGGAIVRGEPVHGLVHTEMGHIPLPRLEGDTFAGACRVHGRCWEGLCAGPAIQARTGKPAEDLAADDPAWTMVTHAMGQALATITYVLSPARIIVGGSVRKAGKLGEAAFFARVRSAFCAVNADYIRAPQLCAYTTDGGGIDSYIVAPELGDDAGVCGAIALAESATQRR
jgi:fructokinase